MQEMGQDDNKEPKYLSQIDVWAMAFGCMVGWGVFAMSGSTFLPVAGPLGTVIAIGLGMLIMLVIGHNLTYLMSHSSMTGGVYSYTKEAFGRDHAFLSSWFLCLSYLTIVFLNGTALFIVIRILLDDSLQGHFHYSIAGNDIYIGEVIASVLVLAVIGIMFVFAKPVLRRLLTILSLVLLVGTLVISVSCMPFAIKSGNVLSFGSSNLNVGYSIFSIVILAPWAFVGFEVPSFDTANFKFPIKKSKTIIFLAIVAAAIAYASMPLISVAAIPDNYLSWQEYISDIDNLNGIMSVPTFYVAKTILGNFGIAVMTLTAIASILTGIIGGYRATTRVLTTMAEDKILSEKFSKVSVSIIFIMVLSIVLSFFGRNTLNWFVDLTSFGAIVGFGYTSAAAYKIGKTEGKKKAEITGITGVIIAIIFIVVQLVPRLSAMEAMGSEAFLLLSLWCLLGFVFYWRTVNRSSITEYSGMSTSGVILFSLLVYSALLWLAKRIMAEEEIEKIRTDVVVGGIFLLIIIFVGLAVMLYVQNVVRKKHDELERDKIRAVESSLAKSQFLFNMSHDIRTPMNAIIGYTNLARNEESPEKVQEFLGKIDTSSQHLLALIDDILEMSRIESGTIELEYVPVDLCAILDGMRDLFSEQMNQKQMDFHVYTGQVQHRYVWCDRKNLNRVLLNILSNAYKFTPEGGTIKASVWEVSTRDKDYGNYEIRIQDSGIGMSKEFAEKMFNAFERERTTTVSKVEGTGLGLAITKNIIDLMDGTIEVMTSPGNGTEMIIRLKMKFADEKDVEHPKVEESEGEESTIDFSGKRVLLVEDNMINMEIANMILTQAGFIVETAEDGKEAVDKVDEAGAGYYDLVLMDIQMPVMDGYTATRTIRELPDKEKSKVPIIAMTANAFKEDKEAALESGMQGHIAKPIDVEVMLKTINNVLISEKRENKDEKI